MGIRGLGSLLCLLFLVTQAHASIREVDPGDTPHIGANEGFLVIAVDTDFAIEALRLQRSGSLSAELLGDIKPGVKLQLYVASAGEYNFDHISPGRSGYQYRLGNDAEFHFAVKAGVINYPGDLIVRKAGFLQANIWLSNRGLRAMDWMETTHPSLQSYRLSYTGLYPDPFPDFYREKRGTRAMDVATFDAPTKPPVDDKLPIDIEDLWRPSRVEMVRINGGGDLVAEVSRDKDVWNVDLINLMRATSVRLVKTEASVAALDWKTDRTLILTLSREVPRNVAVIQITDADADHPHAEMFSAPRAGYVVDMLASDTTHILFGSQSPSGHLRVDRIDVSSKQAIEASTFKDDRLNSGVLGATDWLADGTGKLRAAIAPKDGKTTLFYGAEGNYRAITLPGSPGSLRPVGLAPEGDLIYALADEGRSQRDLVTFDPVSQTIRSTLFSKPRVDVESLLVDRHRRAVGVLYYQEGNLVSEYFDAERARLNANVARAFPGESVVITDYDDTERHVILRVDSATRPATYFHLDMTKNRASVLDDGHPWFQGRTFAPTTVIHANGTDGLPIEAFLTLPKTTPDKPRPLVVVAHGGPIGIRDAVRFDPNVQLIASLGYAVLQVNFRGSEGYGKAFREAGKGQYGTLIEDDIDAALTAALSSYPLDKQRMCALGMSYGGYSSLISSIRWPGRFRCVISMMGVSDWPLLFTASDSGRSKSGRKALEDAFGDPRLNMDSQLKTSPLYKYEELKTPLLLVHGTEDQRVDFEHTRRLERMLALADHRPSLIELKGAAHGITTPEERKLVWPAVARFLEDHLGQP